ncbi:hypothetical protein EYD45_13150 [Hyunsoonleella flava]|uniref:Uncharacterized protein n=1 Tax=Hyunsoonleella flava TaxID=2527939 RepID=A0A4Q9FBG5_9FLAO|nr:hypothetical protein [Hyunsoonleella flava]TBN01348.1 hypothetical protein EYD45_13150 [Hyunsoonleella flava]
MVSILVSCGGNRTATSSNSLDDIKQTPKIVFLNYTIKKDNNGKKTIDFISSKKVDGKLKNQKKFLDKNGHAEDLICSQFDASSATLSQQLIKNPLLKHVEYVDETKNFRIVKMELDSADFTVRLQLYPETKYIAINYNNEKRPLILTKVSEL